jgi:outer membrane biogenesis lipoprotein LolB
MRAAFVLAASAALALTACGERPQVVSYKQGTYQGKPDTPPYAAQYKGNRQEWENAIATRNQAQNEYKRVP